MPDPLEPLPLDLFDDNPAEFDLIGLAPTASTIARVLVDARLNPLTVGVNSPWGGGKSTTLKLIEQHLEASQGCVVVTVDPWEFVDSGDPRGTLITRVLDGIQTEVENRAAAVVDEGGSRALAIEKAKQVAAKLNDLRRRISWSKVAQVALKSAITLTPNIPDLVDAFTPQDQATKPDAQKGMQDFRHDFAELLASLPAVSRVVVLVDDLDRCLPNDVLGAFEAIKLFLSVKGMAFVVAADEDFIRESLREALNRNGRGKFADRYTEKVIQLPFTLPRLSKPDAEAYITTLLVDSAAGSDSSRAVARAAAERRAAGNAPYVFPGMHEGLPTSEQAKRAAAIARGMSPTQSETPRQIKRFLNNYAVRAGVLSSSFADFHPELLMKLWILEQNHSARFSELASTSEAERTALFASWEDPGFEASDSIGDWARDGLLASEHIQSVNSYVSFAATVLTNVALGGSLDDAQSRQLAALLSDSEVTRRGAQTDLGAGGQEGEHQIVEHLVAAMVGDRESAALDSISQLAALRGDLIPVMTESIKREQILRSLGTQHIPWLTAFPDALRALQELRGDEADLMEVIADELSGGGL